MKAQEAARPRAPGPRVFQMHCGRQPASLKEPQQ